MGSAKVAIGGRVIDDAENLLSSAAYDWTTLVSNNIVTTMQVQDLKDQSGDCVRGRPTAPLVL